MTGVQTCALPISLAITLSDDEISDHEFGSDEDGNFIAFIAIVIVDKSVVVDENPSDGELSENVDCKKPIISFARLLQRML